MLFSYFTAEASSDFSNRPAFSTHTSHPFCSGEA
jgi:hypothetical protein